MDVCRAEQGPAGQDGLCECEERVNLINTIIIAVAVLLSLLLLGWVGLQTEPAPFPPLAEPAAALETVPLPEGLPPPVERFYRTLYGSDLPRIESAVISGRGTMRIGGITFPVRFRFTHETGRNYRHYIETTFFGLPVMTVNEYYINGTARLELPFGVVEGPKVDQGANLALWAEDVWMPAVWTTDPRARFEPVDEHTAELVVPFGDAEERIILHFDPETALLQTMQSMRYKGEESETRTLWLNEVGEWSWIDGRLVPGAVAIAWGDEASPWAMLTTEEVAYNVQDSLQAREL